MKMTVEIHGVSEDYASDMKREIENACSCYGGAYGDIQPCCFVRITDEDNPDYKVERCAMCHCEHFASELDSDGLCCDCAEKLHDGNGN